jgi:hypothetical protein
MADNDAMSWKRLAWVLLALGLVGGIASGYLATVENYEISLGLGMGSLLAVILARFVSTSADQTRQRADQTRELNEIHEHLAKWMAEDEENQQTVRRPSETNPNAAQQEILPVPGIEELIARIHAGDIDIPGLPLFGFGGIESHALPKVSNARQSSTEQDPPAWWWSPVSPSQWAFSVGLIFVLLYAAMTAATGNPLWAAGVVFVNGLCAASVFAHCRRRKQLIDRGSQVVVVEPPSLEGEGPSSERISTGIDRLFARLGPPPGELRTKNFQPTLRR